MESKVEISTKDHPIVVNLVDSKLPLPESATIVPYETYNKKKMTKEAVKRRKYKSFSYYRTKQHQKDPIIVKILFLDPDTYLHVSEYPFVLETFQVKKFQQLNDSNPERLTVCEALLIGERNEDAIVRKVHLCQMLQEEGSIDTVKDEFQRIPVTNQIRFSKVVSFLRERLKNKDNPSMRVFIMEDGDNAKILDFDYFYAEKKCLQRFGPKK